MGQINQLLSNHCNLRQGSGRVSEEPEEEEVTMVERLAEEKSMGWPQSGDVQMELEVWRPMAQQLELRSQGTEDRGRVREPADQDRARELENQGDTTGPEGRGGVRESKDHGGAGGWEGQDGAGESPW